MVVIPALDFHGSLIPSDVAYVHIEDDSDVVGVRRELVIAMVVGIENLYSPALSYSQYPEDETLVVGNAKSLLMRRILELAASKIHIIYSVRN